MKAHYSSFQNAALLGGLATSLFAGNVGCGDPCQLKNDEPVVPLTEGEISLYVLGQGYKDYISGHGYKYTQAEQDEFNTDVCSFLTSFQEHSFYGKHLDNFRMTRINTPLEECYLMGGTPFCAPEEIADVIGESYDSARDTVLVFYDGNASISAGKATDNIAVIDAAYAGSSQPLHELGHAFGGLGDERGGGTTYPDEPSLWPNCATSLEECQNLWENYEGQECLPGCGGNDYRYRFSDSCLMNYTTSEDFCPVCEDVLEDRILELSQ